MRCCVPEEEDETTTHHPNRGACRAESEIELNPDGMFSFHQQDGGFEEVVVALQSQGHRTRDAASIHGPAVLPMMCDGRSSYSTLLIVSRVGRSAVERIIVLLAAAPSAPELLNSARASCHSWYSASPRASLNHRPLLPPPTFPGNPPKPPPFLPFPPSMSMASSSFSL